MHRNTLKKLELLPNFISLSFDKNGMNLSVRQKLSLKSKAPVNQLLVKEQKRANKIDLCQILCSWLLLSTWQISHKETCSIEQKNRLKVLMNLLFWCRRNVKIALSKEFVEQEKGTWAFSISRSCVKHVKQKFLYHWCILFGVSSK